MPENNDIILKGAHDDIKGKKAVFVLFGATGDLARRYLIPAIRRIHDSGFKMPVIAISRRDYTTKDYVTHLNLDLPESFVKQLTYFKTDYTDDPKEFGKAVSKARKESGKGSFCVFYLAVPPELYEPITEYLEASGILDGTERIIYEKPFGHNLKSAEKLNKCILDNFEEEQVYRIDHYLAKELVQKIMIFRFANSIFEEIWNNRFVDNIQIIISEKEGIGTRSQYYDNSGAVRDVLQNHLLQVMSLIAMERPKNFDANSLRDRKLEVFRNVRLYDYIMGQYDGYLDEKGVSKGSNTETLAAAKLFVNNERWRGVPFYLVSGKGLHKRFAEVNIFLKVSKNRLFSDEKPNVISINIQPDEGIKILFNGKEPGSMNLISAVMDYCHKCLFNGNTPETYEKLIGEVIRGDQTLFTRWDEVEETWKIAEKMLKGNNKLFKYEQGKNPKQLYDFLEKDGRKLII